MRIDSKNLTAFSALVRICLWAVLFLTLGEVAPAAGPVVYGDCTLSWIPNTELDLAGYRIYMGRTLTQLNLVRDTGTRTSIRCSEAGATVNGQWFVAASAYDMSGNESPRSQIWPFELTGVPIPLPSAQLAEPFFPRLLASDRRFTLSWFDPNQPHVSHRIEVSSSLRPEWTTLTVRPPGELEFNYFQPMEAQWVCYRVRGERDAVVSAWAKAGGSNLRQLCFTPTAVPSIEQPILVPTIFYEPTAVRLTVTHPGFTLSWGNTGEVSTVSHRIEVSGSVDSGWTTIAVVPPGLRSFGFARQIDAEWICVRIRAEQQRIVSLWAMAGGPNDRQFCFVPES